MLTRSVIATGLMRPSSVYFSENTQSCWNRCLNQPCDAPKIWSPKTSMSNHRIFASLQVLNHAKDVCYVVKIRFHKSWVVLRIESVYHNTFKAVKCTEPRENRRGNLTITAGHKVGTRNQLFPRTKFYNFLQISRINQHRFRTFRLALVQPKGLYGQLLSPSHHLCA
jgi:hypothetical protein